MEGKILISGVADGLAGGRGIGEGAGGDRGGGGIFGGWSVLILERVSESKVGLSGLRACWRFELS